ncbi:MAG: protein translocase subunit SecD [Candidatus Omnitrophica bacterium]|nr:protein translocase subunit SecD [Candidatus Omnitrophota bacterium]
MQRNLKWKIGLAVAVIALSAVEALPLNKKIHLGLDLSGGMHLVLKVDTSALEPEQRADATERALEIIRNRVDQFGVAEPNIQLQGKERILVQLPGVTDRERAVSLIGQTALLEFKLVSDDAALLAEAQGGSVPAGYNLKKLEDTGDELLVHQAVSLKGETLVNAYVGSDSYGLPAVDFQLSQKGGRIFSRLTEENVGKRLAILLDGNVKSAPEIRSTISTNGQITGRFTYDEAHDLAIILRAGALPAPIQIEEERTVGPTLGRDSVDQGVKASVFALVLVLIFIVLYYGWVGVVADFALALNMLIVLAAMAYLKSSLTLPGIAGLILTIGMSVDANVIINERIREEIRNGHTLRSAITNGYKSAFWTIFDANLTTVVSAFILYHLGSGPVKGFAVTLMLGIAASMFTAIFVTRLIFDLVAGHGPFKAFPMHTSFPAPHFRFIARRRWAYAASLVVIFIGFAAFAARGNGNYGIDFTGGVLQEMRFRDSVEMDAVREALTESGFGNLPVQQFGGEKELIVRSPLGSGDVIQEQFEKKFGAENFEVVRVESVGPAVGKELRMKAVQALLLGLVAICLYVGFRFRFDFSLAAIVALVHDVLVTVGLCALTGKELSLPLIAALLTIVGYSINDTIVIFDRIRDKLRHEGRKPLEVVIDESVNETLSRTILTSFTTLVVVIVLFAGGGEVIRDFSFALLVGVVAGSYSTVYVASSLLVTWQKKLKPARA